VSRLTYLLEIGNGRSASNLQLGARARLRITRASVGVGFGAEHSPQGE
jgi:hypothetical protein